MSVNTCDIIIMDDSIESKTKKHKEDSRVDSKGLERDLKRHDKV